MSDWKEGLTEREVDAIAQARAEEKTATSVNPLLFLFVRDSPVGAGYDVQAHPTPISISW